MTRRIGSAVLGLLALSLLVVAASKPTEVRTVRRPNEVLLPGQGGWHKTPVPGLETQLLVPLDTISPEAKALPVVVWFRNSTDGPVSSTWPMGPDGAFVPHGTLEVHTDGHRSVVGGQCLKKHLMQQLNLDPGQVRGFLCDAFNQGCFRKVRGDLAPGKLVLTFMGAKATVLVGKHASR